MALFITVEGTEGAGKTSCLDTVAATLTKLGHPPVITREPGGTPYAEQIRALLLNHSDEPVANMTELLLMFAARAQHIEQLIKPALAQGEFVVSDRFTDATFAYQGGGRELDTTAISQLEALVQQGLQPDLTLLLDLPVEIGLARASARSEPDRIELEKAAFFDRVRQGYLARAKQDPNRFLIIDASQSVDKVQADVIAGLLARIEAHQDA